MNNAMNAAREVGFETVEALNVETLHAMVEVRDMCATDKCDAYGKNWSCPPACGTLEECAQRMAKYTQGFLIQTVGELEDSWDYEGMEEIIGNHKDRVEALNDKLKDLGGEYLLLTAGGCTLCKKCNYPEPCRFPHKMLSSMEAYGLLVSKVCQDNNVKYYYGSDKLAYTGCVLIP